MKAVDRTEANRALAKVIAYINCDKEADATLWFRRLAEELGMKELLK